MNALKNKSVIKYKVIFIQNDKIISMQNVSYMNKESAVRRARYISKHLGENVTFILKKK